MTPISMTCECVAVTIAMRDCSARYAKTEPVAPLASRATAELRPSEQRDLTRFLLRDEHPGVVEAEYHASQYKESARFEQSRHRQGHYLRAAMISATAPESIGLATVAVKVSRPTVASKCQFP